MFQNDAVYNSHMCNNPWTVCLASCAVNRGCKGVEFAQLVRGSELQIIPDILPHRFWCRRVLEFPTIPGSCISQIQRYRHPCHSLQTIIMRSKEVPAIISGSAGNRSDLCKDCMQAICTMHLQQNLHNKAITVGTRSRS